MSDRRFVPNPFLLADLLGQDASPSAALRALGLVPEPVLTTMIADQYLRQILAREAVDVGPFSPVRQVQTTLHYTLSVWANGNLIAVTPSGSFAKGTANRSGTDIDLFISLSDGTPETLADIFNKLDRWLQGAGYFTRRQNVSIGITAGGQTVDLVPAKRQNLLTDDHSLYRSKANTWTKTNVGKHVALVRSSGRLEEIRVLKLWRDQNGLNFPSFYLELAVIEALAPTLLGAAPYGDLANNVWIVFQYLRDRFPTARVLDPANSNNVISDDLTGAEKTAIQSAATGALAASNWNQIVR
jgi:hypothetical protein